MARRHVVMEMEGRRRKGKIKRLKKEPRWKVRARGTVKSLKRLAFQTLAVVGLVTVIVLIARSL